MTMTDMLCGYSGDRDASLVAYLYDDIAPGERDAFSAHLKTCARCRAELDELTGVRAQLAKWAPPEPAFSAGLASHQPPATSDRSWWRDIPAWAQVAAALLFLGVSAGI